MKDGLVFIGIVVLILAAVGGIGYLISLFNSLIQVKNNIGKAWHNIDVLLLQRNEELPKLIDVTKAYAIYEKELFEELVRLRKKYRMVKRTDQKTDVENQLSMKLRQILGKGERYPELNANVLFAHIQHRISDLQHMIADRRAFFNDTVTIYNIQIEKIPQVVFARLLGFRRHPLLKVPEEKKR